MLASLEKFYRFAIPCVIYDPEHPAYLYALRTRQAMMAVDALARQTVVEIGDDRKDVGKGALAKVEIAAFGPHTISALTCSFPIGSTVSIWGLVCFPPAARISTRTVGSLLPSEYPAVIRAANSVSACDGSPGTNAVGPG